MITDFLGIAAVHCYWLTFHLANLKIILTQEGWAATKTADLIRSYEKIAKVVVEEQTKPPTRPVLQQMINLMHLWIELPDEVSAT